MTQQNTPPPIPETPASMPEIFQQIDELERRFRQFQNATLKEARLTIPQYYILSLLAQKDGRPFKELAEALACRRATITGIVDTLEKKGLVRRAVHPHDRRSTLAWLTEAGQRLLDSTPDLEKTYGSCCEALSPTELHDLNLLLKHLSEALPF
jgi:DNA-binding MarR family transcriptional regulator